MKFQKGVLHKQTFTEPKNSNNNEHLLFGLQNLMNASPVLPLNIIERYLHEIGHAIAVIVS
jgi:hypothetical protein